MRNPLVRDIVTVIRRHQATYNTFAKACCAARKELGLHPVGRSKKLPHLLSDSELKIFYEVIDRARKIEHQVMLRLLFYTAIRVAELTMIKVEDVDVEQCKIFIDDGKGSKDRYVLFPEYFRLIMQSHLAQVEQKGNKYLFESNQKKQYSVRRVQQIVEEYAERAGVRVHPHLLRHQMLTWLTRMGLGDSQIQLISGHSSKVSLEIYQHLGLNQVEGDYQAAVKKISI